MAIQESRQQQIFDAFLRLKGLPIVRHYVSIEHLEDGTIRGVFVLETEKNVSRLWSRLSAHSRCIPWLGNEQMPRFSASEDAELSVQDNTVGNKGIESPKEALLNCLSEAMFVALALNPSKDSPHTSVMEPESLREL